MGNQDFHIRQLADEIQPPESGKKSIVISDDANTKLYCSLLPLGLDFHNTLLPYRQSSCQLAPKQHQ
jgi:hypothetical protein